MQDKMGQQEYTVASAYETDLTDILMKDLQWRYTPKSAGEKRPTRNVVIDVRSFAGTGSGKSTVALIIMYLISQISIGALVTTLKKATFGEVYALDEQRMSEEFGSGSMQYFARLSDIINVSRAMGLGVITVGIPELAFLNYDPHFRIYAEAIDLETDESLFLIADKQDMYRGYAILKKPKDKAFVEFEKEYNTKKMNFIQRNLIGIFKDKHIEREKKAEKLSANPEFWLCQNDDERKWIFHDEYGEEVPMSEQKLVVKRACFLMRRNHPEFFNKKGKPDFEKIAKVIKMKGKQKVKNAGLMDEEDDIEENDAEEEEDEEQ
jgi:hypothetical protein